MVDANVVTVGAVGTGFSLLILYYATGVLLHFVTFNADTVPRYMERLRMETSFEVLLVCLLLYGLGLLAAGGALLFSPTYATYVTLLAFVTLFSGLLYFLRRMLRITAFT